METFRVLFKDIIQDILKIYNAPSRITGENVYQEANVKVTAFVDKILDYLVLPSSGVNGLENLVEMLEKANEGASCLLLLEHYSNTDLPAFSYLLRKAGEQGGKISEALVAIAGMKLNEENQAIAILSSGYTRIIICPTRASEHIDPEKDHDEKLRVMNINRAAMRTLDDIKHTGKLVLVFPAGTRYRHWDPNSKKGIREIDSYIKGFDYMSFVAVNGVLLPPRREVGMIDDYAQKDIMTFTASPVISCEEFRRAVREKAEEDGVPDKKQAVADTIMQRLEEMHRAEERARGKRETINAID